MNIDFPKQWPKTVKEVEIQTFETRPDYLFPYIPGLLAFRELPFLMHALKKIKSPVDVFVVDGHGRLHPRGIGMAVHLGIIINKPTIGSAKNSLINYHYIHLFFLLTMDKLFLIG